MTERELLADCLVRLNRIQVEYYLTGSMASNYWGVPRTTHDLDFVVASSQPFDQEMLARRVQKTIGGIPAWIATAEDVILHKLVWNKISPSDRQLRDAAGVWAIQGSGLNKAHMEKWAATLGVTEELGKIFSGEIRPKST